MDYVGFARYKRESVLLITKGYFRHDLSSSAAGLGAVQMVSKPWVLDVCWGKPASMRSVGKLGSSLERQFHSYPQLRGPV